MHLCDGSVKGQKADCSDHKSQLIISAGKNLKVCFVDQQEVTLGFCVHFVMNFKSSNSSSCM